MSKTLGLMLLALLFISIPVPGAAAAEFSVCVNGEYLAFPVAPVMEEGRVLVPMRVIFQALGASLEWNGPEQKIIARNKDSEIILHIGAKTALVNSQIKSLDVPAKLINGTTLVPLRFVGEALGEQVDWDESTLTAVIGTPPGPAPYQSYSKKIGKHSLNVVEIPPGSLQAGIALGQGHVGGTEELASMAKKVGAKVAINGTFFEAYGGIPEPWGTIIRQGKLAHIGNIGTTLGFTEKGSVKMAPLRISIKGGVNGSFEWPNNWYAYGINRTPSTNSAFLYTPERGAKLGFSNGSAVVVKKNKVVGKTTNEDVAIPEDGYVIVFTGSETYLAGRFKVGDSVAYDVSFQGGDFSDVVTGLGAGPRLVNKGKAVYDPKAEGFTSPKILEMSAARSACGVKEDGTVVLVTTTATVQELSDLMVQLGCMEAMNLDGGASSGLYLNGKYLTKPGRNLSNILYFK